MYGISGGVRLAIAGYADAVFGAIVFGFLTFVFTFILLVAGVVLLVRPESRLPAASLSVMAIVMAAVSLLAFRYEHCDWPSLLWDSIFVSLVVMSIVVGGVNLVLLFGRLSKRVLLVTAFAGVVSGAYVVTSTHTLYIDTTVVAIAVVGLILGGLGMFLLTSPNLSKAIGVVLILFVVSGVIALLLSMR